MTDREKFMYEILGRISDTNAPIVFKGALITKLILEENGYSELNRKTRDIDANWVNTPPTMGVLVDTINQSLGDFRGQCYAVANREYGEKKSAGIDIIETMTDDIIISMDISMKPVFGSRIYHYGEMDIKGVLANEILADKLSVLSSDKIFRRSKDVVDVYALSHCMKTNTSDIFNICKLKQREISSFNAFYTRKAELTHAYNKLEGIDGKPLFDEIYLHLSKYIRPFAEKDGVNRTWNTDKMEWRIDNERLNGDRQTMGMSEWKKLISNKRASESRSIGDKDTRTIKDRDR